MRRPITLILLLAACAREPQPGSRAAGRSSADASGDRPSLPTLAPDSVSLWFARMDARLQPLMRSRDSVIAVLRHASGTTRADSLFVAFRDRYARALDTIGSQTWDDAPFQNWLMSSAAGSDSAEHFFGTRGFRLTWSEGSAYPTANTSVLVRTCKPFLSTALGEFLTLREHDEAQGFSDDAALQVPWDSVGERVVAWERLLNAHPVFVSRAEAEEWYNLYLSTYLTGMDNSPVFEDTLVPAVHASYERFLRRHADTRAAHLVRAYLDILR